jgi:hypothetical protein
MHYSYSCNSTVLLLSDFTVRISYPIVTSKPLLGNSPVKTPSNTRHATMEEPVFSMRWRHATMEETVLLLYTSIMMTRYLIKVRTEYFDEYENRMLTPWSPIQVCLGCLCAYPWRYFGRGAKYSIKVFNTSKLDDGIFCNWLLVICDVKGDVTVYS